jgi:deoxyhypusine synthase
VEGLVDRILANRMSQVYAEATVAFPLIVAATFAKVVEEQSGKTA